MNLEQVWATCLGELEVLLSKANFTTWFKGTSIVKLDSGTAIIATPNSFTKEWLQKKYHDQIIETLKKQVDSIQKIEYIISTGQSSNSALMEKRGNAIIESFQEKEATKEEEFDSLNSRYIFDSFVIGESNRLAHAACMAVAKNPGVTYNPLFIYGGVGLGKTHLIHAIGNEIRKKDKKKNVLYTTCEKFTNEFITLIRKGKGEQFKNSYRNVDALLIDDIQFLAGKESTQQEFFHTFNELHSKSKQIVLTSDRPPKAISSLEDRLVSRFEWGMLADINPPDMETRIAILQNKVAERKCDVNEEIISFIAQHIQNNVRELEGALNRVLAFSELNNKRPTLDDIKTVFGEINSTKRERTLTSKEIMKKIADFYDITPNDILGQKRNKELVYPRQICAYLMRKELNYSFPRIGKELGGKDHTTIMHACDKISKEIEKNDITKHEINSLKEKLYI